MKKIVAAFGLLRSAHIAYPILFALLFSAWGYHKFQVNRAYNDGVTQGKEDAEIAQKEEWESRVELQKERADALAKIAEQTAKTQREALARVMADRKKEADLKIPVPQVIIKEIPQECDDAITSLANSLNPFAARMRLHLEQIEADSTAAGIMPGNPDQ